MSANIKNKQKIYVEVNSDFDPTGYMQPRSVTWKDGRTFIIDKVKGFCSTNIFHEGKSNFCFTVMINGEEKHLYFEPADSVFSSRIGRWYVIQSIRS